MPLSFKSTIEEPIRFFLNYPKGGRPILQYEYENLSETHRYYDGLKKTVMTFVEERIDEEVTEKSLVELSLEEYIRGRFEDEINLSKHYIAETYRTKGDSENTWAYKRLLRAILNNYDKFAKYPDNPESDLLPNALIQIAKHAITLYDNLLVNPLISKVKKIIEEADSQKVVTGFKIKTEYLSKVADFSLYLINAKLVHPDTVLNQWLTFFRGYLPNPRIDLIAEKSPNILWYFVQKLEKSEVMRLFPKQRWKLIPEIFTIIGEDISPDFYKKHNYLDKKSNDKMDKAFDVLKTYTF